MTTKTRSIVATIVAFLGAVWHYHEVSVGVAKMPPGPFPFLPASITTVACLLALRWWNEAKDAAR